MGADRQKAVRVTRAVNLGRAVNRQPCLPHGMTRRAFPLLEITYRQNNLKMIQKCSPTYADHFMLFCQRVQNIFRKRSRPPSEDQKPKIFRIRPKRYRNDPRGVLSILCLFAKKEKMSSYKVDFHEQKNSIPGRPQTRPLSVRRL